MPLIGSFAPQGDKSISHRLALIALLAGGSMRLTNLSSGQDVSSSLEALARLGGGYERAKAVTVVHGAGGQLKSPEHIDCGNSGTTIRLLMGLLAGRPGEWTLDGDDSLRKRPMERVAAPLRLMGAEVECRDGTCPVRVRGGGLTGIDYRLPVASAQLKTALLLAGLSAKGATTIVEPAPSRDHTERLLPLLGGTITRLKNAWKVEPGPLSLPEAFFVPGDPSSAAFFLCTAALWPGSKVTARGVLLNPTRTGFLKVLSRMNAPVEQEPGSDIPEPWGNVTVSYSDRLKAADIAPDEVPSLVDEIPILALCATQAQGISVFRGLKELRIKETDRLKAIAEQLGRFGASIQIKGDDLIIQGPTRLKVPKECESLGDHRMAMTLRLAAEMSGGSSTIHDEECYRVSYPGFMEDLGRLSA